MGLLTGPTANPLGLHAGLEKVRAKAPLTAIAVGQCVYFDLAAAASGVTASTAFGASTSPTANVVLATATHDGTLEATAWIHGIALTAAAAAGDELWVCVRGVCQALINGTPATGTYLTPTADSELTTAIDDCTNVGITLETGVNATLKWVVFDGINHLAGGHMDIA